MSLTLGEAIRQLREDRGMSAQDLAEKSGVSMDAIKSIEQGRRNPRPATKMKIVEALGISLDRLKVMMQYGEEQPIEIPRRGRPPKTHVSIIGGEVDLRYESWDLVHHINMTPDEALRVGIELVVHADKLIQERKERIRVREEKKEAKRAAVSGETQGTV